MNRDEFIMGFNARYRQRKPFVFLIDFEREQFILFDENEAVKNRFWLAFGQRGLFPAYVSVKRPSLLRIHPVSYDEFKEKFDRVIYHLRRGDTYLLNLTFSTPVELKGSLQDVFYAVSAPFKAYFDDRFVFFSPEKFVIIDEHTIRTFPMKGTADASKPGARKQLLENKKEQFEHNTVVDLLRNDISLVSIDVEVRKYRYIDEITTTKGKILQVSSEIAGRLDSRWFAGPAESFLRMLPAGSVSGAPKPKTLEIIRRVEGEKRGFYTGITGWFDGQKLVSAVNIRYIERQNGKLFYRSGGGITALSNLQDEYEEYIRKIYLPLA